MTETTYEIENVPIAEFLGVQNENIKAIAAAFPGTRIVSRGNLIKIQGITSEIDKVLTILSSIESFQEASGILNLANVKNILENNGSSVALPTDKSIIVTNNYGRAIKPQTPNQTALVEAITQKDIVFAVGPAGTGKTFIAVAMAVKALKEKKVKKIIFTRPAVEAGESLGFLPGDLKEKIDPYLRPIYDALEELLTLEKIASHLENKVIEIAPLAFMRGRTLHDAFVILDEAQNTTPMQLKMFLTRIGISSKAVVTGDTSQIDLPTKQKSGLVDAIEVLKDIKGIAFKYLTDEDVRRHELVKEILKAYDRSAGN